MALPCRNRLVVERGGDAQFKQRPRNTGKAGPPVTVDVVVAITYFYFGQAPIDVDNMAKPILDALKGFIYQDDKQVTVLVSRKRDLGSDLPDAGQSALLMERLSAPGSFVHILVDDARNREVIV